MPILNYTTTVSSDKSIGQIQKCLAKHGVSQVLTEYGTEGEVAAVSFRMLYNDVMISFRLPAHVDSIYVIMQNEKRVQRKHRTRDHARRIAWRIIKDWVEAQLALVEAEQAEMVEVFLPYAQDPRTGETIFKKLARSDFKLLGGPS